MKQPNAKTIIEIRCLSYAFTVKAAFHDVAQRDGFLRLTEYSYAVGTSQHAYAVGTSQPGVPRTIQEARAMPDAAEWQAAANREMTNLKERKVYKLGPRKAVPPGRKRIKAG